MSLNENQLAVSNLLLEMGDILPNDADLVVLDETVVTSESPEKLFPIMLKITRKLLEIKTKPHAALSREKKEQIKARIAQTFVELNRSANSAMEKLFRMFRHFSVIPTESVSYRSYVTMIKALSAAVMHIENPECARKSEAEREAAAQGDATIDDIMCDLSNSIIPAPMPYETVTNREIVSGSDATAVDSTSSYGSIYLLMLKRRNVAVKVPKVKDMETLIEATVGLVIANTLIRRGLWDDHAELARFLPFYGVFSCDAPNPIQRHGRATLPICSSAGTDPVLYTVTKRMDAPTLGKLLDENGITFEQLEKVVRQVWSLLIVLNESDLKFVHNDLHADNIFVDLSDPAQPVATIFDFGLSSFTIDGQRVYGEMDSRFIEFGISLGFSPSIREMPDFVSGIVDLIQLLFSIEVRAKDEQIKGEYFYRLWGAFGYINNGISPKWASFDAFRDDRHILLRNSPIFWNTGNAAQTMDFYSHNLKFFRKNRYAGLANHLISPWKEVGRLQEIGRGLNRWFDIRLTDVLPTTPIEELKRSIDEF